MSTPQHPAPTGAEATAPIPTVGTSGEGNPATASVPPHSATVPPAVVATDIVLKGEEGVVFGPLNFTIPGRGLTVLTGRGGSGRTALALVLSGRMKLSSGTLEVQGETNRSTINKQVAIAGVDTIDELDREVTLRTVLTEHRSWSKPWFSWTRTADDDYLVELLGDVYGERTLPPLDVYIAQLSAYDRILIRIALALHPANHREITMLVMDDLEQVHELDERFMLVRTLDRLAQTMPVVVNSVNPLPEGLVPGHTSMELFTDAHHVQPENPGYSAAVMPFIYAAAGARPAVSTTPAATTTNPQEATK